jgi:chemotaxis family two-component system sensor kinase Cph1
MTGKKENSHSGSETKRSKKKKSAAPFEALRRKAEETLKELEGELAMIPIGRVQDIVQELRVHQIELEMQNEELRRTQEELERSRSRYSYLYDFAPIGYLTCNREGTILEINLTGARQLGYERTMLIGRPFSVHLQGDEMKAFYSCLKEVFESKSKHSCELRLKRRDGSRLDVHLESIASAHDGDIQCLAAIMDISGLKRVEEEMKQLTAELKRSNEDLQQFASAVSHDLQEPLQVIKGFLALLERHSKGKLDEKAQELIRFAVEGSKRMEDIIRDLLEYSRVGTKAREFKPADCSLILNEAISNLKTSIEEERAEVTRDSLPTVMADASQLTRLFQNLISNAIKFHGAEAPRVHVSAERKGDEWLFSVRDNGIGIDMKYADTIFAAFKRLHSDDKFRGTGIGLAVCKKIVEFHGGRIWVESRPGNGSTFYFRIPLREADTGGRHYKNSDSR